MRKLQDLLGEVEVIAKGAPFGNRNAAKDKGSVQDATKNKDSVQDPANNRLSAEQIASVKKEMVPSSQATPVRFMKEGHNINITSGEAVKGSNIINQVHYWNFTKETSNKIADMIGAKPIFSEEEKADPWKEQRKAEQEYEIAEENHNKVGSKETLAQLHSAKEKLMESSRAIDEMKKGAPFGNRNAAKNKGSADRWETDGHPKYSGYRKTDKYIQDVKRTLYSLSVENGKLFEHDRGMAIGVKRLENLLPNKSKKEMLEGIDKEYTATVKQANNEKDSAKQRELMGTALVYQNVHNLLSNDTQYALLNPKTSVYNRGKGVKFTLPQN